MDESDQKKYRLTAATMMKFMSRARQRREPNFISKEQWRRWWNTEEPNRPASVRVLLEQALKYRGRVTDIEPLESYAIGERDEPTVFELVDRFIDENAVSEAIRELKQNANADIDWERLARWQSLSGIRDGLDQLPGDKPATRKKGGRPPISEAKAQKRQELAEAWKRARDAGTSKKDFCKDRKISLAELDKALDWDAKRCQR